VITRRGALLLMGAIVLWAVGRFLGVSELYVVAVATAALVACATVAVRVATANVSVRRHVAPARVLGGGTGEVKLELRNDARLPAALLLVEDACPAALSPTPRFVVPGLGAGRTTAFRYPISGSARGRYTVGPMRLRVRDPFGLAQRIRRYRGTAEIVVYPHIEPLEDPPAPGTQTGSGSSAIRRLFNTGDEFYTMREYVQGDDLRQVHWPSTAHRNVLMVRQQEQPWEAEATILCDTRRLAHRHLGPGSAMEKAIALAASLVWHLADDGFTLRLMTEAETRMPAVQPWTAMLDRLAELEPTRLPSLVPALQRLRGGGGEGLLAAVIATPPGDEPLGRHPDIRALLQAGRSFHGRLALVVDSGTTQRATQTVALLRTAGWRAVTITPQQTLASRWRSLGGGRRPAQAFQPGVA
jgi:uncharacterized protein (DUF58 family)